VPRSPAGPARLSSYEDAWEAINRLIREGGSWSGSERNCFYLGAGGGTLVNVSAASGLDFLDDGRAFAVLDLDGDGDPDLILKNRTGPQLRVLRNDLPPLGGRVEFKLTGRRANRDAVGARVTLRAGGQVRTASVKCGSGFLSQNSPALSFALPWAKKIDLAEVRWPGGTREEFRDLPLDRRYRLLEGMEPVGEAFRPASRPRDAASREGDPPAREETGRREGWLLAELRPPDLELTGTDGRPVRLEEFRGRPLLLGFFSPRCPLCAGELREREERWPEIASSGLAVVAAEAEEPEGGAGGGSEPVERALRIERGSLGRFRLARAGPRALLACGVLVHQAFRWPKEMQVPQSLLIDRSGLLAKIYRGPVAWEVLARDLALLSQAADRTRLGLPFPGRWETGEPRRDHFQLGIGYVEEGLGELARGSFRRAIELRPEDGESLFNLGVLLGGLAGPPAVPHEAGLLEARRCFEKALALHPDFVDAHSNLGVVLARSGDLAGAEREFSEALALRPGHAESLLNLGGVRLSRGEPEEALLSFQAAVAAEPELPAPRKKLGETYRRMGKSEEAIAAFREALRLDPRDAETRSNLAVVLAEAGRLPEAALELEAALEARPRHAAAFTNLGLVRERQGREEEARQCFRSAIEADPSLAEPYLNLGKSLLRSGESKEAAGVLRSLLKRKPDHREALSLLSKIKDPER
jgi:tetratricopeptide (TPR) repeat protein